MGLPSPGSPIKGMSRLRRVRDRRLDIVDVERHQVHAATRCARRACRRGPSSLVGLTSSMELPAKSKKAFLNPAPFRLAGAADRGTEDRLVLGDARIEVGNGDDDVVNGVEHGLLLSAAELSLLGFSCSGPDGKALTRRI